MRKLLLVLLFSVLLMGIVSASIGELKPQQVNTNITLPQTSDSATFQNISSILLSNGTLVILNAPMTKSGSNFYYILDKSYVQSLGRYCVNGIGDDTDDTTWNYCFEVTRNGESSTNSQAVITMGIIGVMFLFFGLGRAFNKDKWKLKLAFDILALMMAVVAINSFRIIVSESSNLGTLSMGALVSVIAILSFMVGYFLVLITLEIINYFKNKENLRWQVKSEAY